jgi:flagellar biosynthesis protein FliR
MLSLALNFIPIYVLVLFRIAGMMIMAPLLGSAQVPKRVKTLIACVIAAAIVPGLHLTARIPDSPWELALAIAGEILFGAAIGFIISLIFVAAQWAGEIIGQQMGLNLGQTLNPQYGGSSSAIGDIYFYLALLVFLSMHGHLMLIKAVVDSFDALPLLSATLSRPLVNLLAGVLQSATTVAFQLAAPMIVTMLIVDLLLGFIGKTMPQLNIMSAGVSLRIVVGTVVLVVGIGLTSSIMRENLLVAMKTTYRWYVLPHV